MFRHVIPVNIQDNGNFGNGFLKKRNTVEAAIIFVVMFLFFKYAFYAAPFLIKTILFVTFGVLPAIIALIGIGDESLSEALATFRAYKKVPDKLSYSLAALGVEVEEEKKETKLKGKEKRAAKKEAKEKRREEQIAAKAKAKTDKIHAKTEKKIQKRKKKND